MAEELTTYTKELASPFILMVNGAILCSPDGSPILGAASDEWHILRANLGTPHGGEGRVHGCYECGEPFRESELVRFRGNWYCHKNGHVGVIGSILKKEAADRFVPDSSGESPAMTVIIRNTEDLL